MRGIGAAFNSIEMRPTAVESSDGESRLHTPSGREASWTTANSLAYAIKAKKMTDVMIRVKRMPRLRSSQERPEHLA